MNSMIHSDNDTVRLMTALSFQQKHHFLAENSRYIMYTYNYYYYENNYTNLFTKLNVYANQKYVVYVF